MPSVAYLSRECQQSVVGLSRFQWNFGSKSRLMTVQCYSSLAIQRRSYPTRKFSAVDRFKSTTKIRRWRNDCGTTLRRVNNPGITVCLGEPNWQANTGRANSPDCGSRPRRRNARPASYVAHWLAYQAFSITTANATRQGRGGREINIMHTKM